MRLLARKLENCPAADELPIVAEVLTDDLIAAGHVRADRVGAALETIGRYDMRWPQPARVIEVVRQTANDEAMAYHKRLPPPERTPEQLERIQNLIKEARKALS